MLMTSFKRLFPVPTFKNVAKNEKSSMSKVEEGEEKAGLGGFNCNNGITTFTQLLNQLLTKEDKRLKLCLDGWCNYTPINSFFTGPIQTQPKEKDG